MKITITEKMIGLCKDEKNTVTVTSFLHLSKLFLIQRESNDGNI